MLRMITGRPSPTGFESATTAEQVTEDIDGSKLTAIVAEVVGGRRWWLTMMAMSEVVTDDCEYSGGE
ncbi:hypothetical protein BC332_23078 [Capsicum chinense]|nr:hypothetical protein BC332_23078 [Capsicum chinense]